jgi:hypothetical protein
MRVEIARLDHPHGAIDDDVLVDVHDVRRPPFDRPEAERGGENQNRGDGDRLRVTLEKPHRR